MIFAWRFHSYVLTSQLGECKGKRTVEEKEFGNVVQENSWLLKIARMNKQGGNILGMKGKV